MHTAIDWITEAVLKAEARGEPIGPSALTLLLRRYTATGQQNIRDALERALTRALDTGRPFRSAGEDVERAAARHAEAPEAHKRQGRLSTDLNRPHGGDHTAAAWLQMFSEASTITDDERIAAAIADSTNALRGSWPSRGPVAPAMRSVAACLAAAHVLEPDAPEVIRAAIDELERIVCRVYRPGETLARSLERPDEPDGRLEDHIDTAATLLTAHAVTGRLPYAMLAEELARFAIRHLRSRDFAARSDAVRVLCRLALLHDDPDYRRVAVVARECDYRGEARRLLHALSSSYRALGAGAAIYAVALDEFLRAS